MRYYSALAAALVAILASYLWTSLVSQRDGVSNDVNFGGKWKWMASKEEDDSRDDSEDSEDEDSSDDAEDDDYYEIDEDDEDIEDWPILEGTPMPDLNWHLQGDAPFVIVDGILPKPLLERILLEIEKGTEHVPGESAECTLERDGSDCGDERWFPYTLEEKGKPRDIFEQAVEAIVKADMERVLPPAVAAAVKGASWRILLAESGEPNSVFHYDSDEDTDYAVPGAPLIHPLLATVTYLTDYGTPTLVFDHAITSREKLYEPKAAYVCMPRANKHIGFDPRLLHGSGAPIPKGKGEKLRIIIGMNYHTVQSLETKVENVTVNENGLVKPIDVSENGDMTVTPWNNGHNIISEQETRETWERFWLEMNHHALDFCGSMYAPCHLSVRLPVGEILYNETDNAGATIGFQLAQGDFVIRQVPSKKRFPGFEPSGDKAKSLALSMLRERCAIYEKGVSTMNPPLNNAC